MALSEAVMVMWNGREVSEREVHSDLPGNGTRATGTQSLRRMGMQQGR